MTSEERWANYRAAMRRAAERRAKAAQPAVDRWEAKQWATPSAETVSNARLEESLDYWMERCTHFENVASKTWGDLSVARQERDAARAEAARLREDHAGRALGEQIAKRSQERDAARAEAERLRELLRECQPEVVDRHGAMHVDMPWSWWERRTAALAQEPKQ